jgi:hypothetical protein
MTFLAPGQRGGRRRRRLDEGEGEGNMSGWLVSQGDKAALQTVGVVGEPKKLAGGGATKVYICTGFHLRPV